MQKKRILYIIDHQATPNSLGISEKRFSESGDADNGIENILSNLVGAKT